jgi:tetratricopeptide (TPR) repeat protein
MQKEPSRAVFLSYASQDAGPAQRISEALRAAGIEVWFDRSELRGGDVWDQTIRRQIKTCTLFIPVISRHTHERREGYFRLEWKLAVDRSHLISATQAFLVPVAIDDSREDDEEVPERIREVHWTRLPDGETPPAFVEWIKGLLTGAMSPDPLARRAPASAAFSQAAAARGFGSYRIAVYAAVVAAAFRGDYLTGTAREQAYANAQQAADRALALSPDLAPAHLAKGTLLQLADFDWRGSEAEFRRALQLNLNDALAKFYLGRQRAIFGDPESAIEYTQQALVSEPLQPYWYGWLARYFMAVDRLNEAEWAIHRARELQPAVAGRYQTLTLIEILRGHPSAALSAARRETPGVARDGALALARQIGDDRGAADAALKTLIDEDATSSAYQIAEVYALRNDPTHVFEWLDRAWSTRDPDLRDLLFDPIILRYKGDPRLAMFCRKVGLPVAG